MRLLLTVTICLLMAVPSLIAQKLIDFNLAISLPELIIESNLGTDVDHAVDAYSVLYTTTDLEGRLDTASGLIMIPSSESGSFPRAIYQHGTVSSRDDVPSQLRGGWELGLALASFGYITIAPDYQGLGTSRGIHPYVHADSEAQAAIDMLFALDEFLTTLDDNSVTASDQLFITGYSQGGHAAMAAHRNIERDYADQITVTASAPMSGPYSISGDMIEFTLVEAEFPFLGYIAWTTLSYQRAYKDEFPSALSDFFIDKYIAPIESFAREEIDLGQLNAELRNLMLEENDLISPRLMLKEDVLDIIINRLDHPISRAFEDNDVIDWSPQAPVRMMYCGADEQVWFQNALTAEDVLMQTGDEDVKAVLIDENGTHGSCVVPAFLETVEFFNSLRDMTSPTVDERLNEAAIRIYPNPTTSVLHFSSPADLSIKSIQLYSIDGRLIKTVQPDEQLLKSVDVSDVAPGLYNLQLISADRNLHKRIFIE